MCGIAGILTYRQTNAPVNRDELLKIRDAMAARGPDGAGLWINDDGRVGLAHRRLAIIDLEGGRQPMSSADGKTWIVFNGEIYNFKQLRQELTGAGHIFRSQSDSETIVHAYEEYGEDFVLKLDGMFAIAVWDAEQKKLILCRDRIGIKFIISRWVRVSVDDFADFGKIETGDLNIQIRHFTKLI